MQKIEYTDVDFEMFVMPFGEHAGKSIEELGAGYVLWLMEQDYCPPILKAWAELHEEDIKEKEDEAVNEWLQDDWFGRYR